MKTDRRAIEYYYTRCLVVYNVLLENISIQHTFISALWDVASFVIDKTNIQCIQDHQATNDVSIAVKNVQ